MTIPASRANGSSASARGKPLAEIASDDAPNVLVHLLHASLSTDAQPGSGQQTEAECRQQPQQQRLPDDEGYLARLIDTPPHHEDVAVGELSARGLDDGIAGRRRTDPIELDAPDRPAEIEMQRQSLNIADNPIPGRIEQACILHAPGILPEMVGNRVVEAAGRQLRQEAELCLDHAVGPHDQVIVDLDVNEGEQPGDEQRQRSCHRGDPEKRARSNEINPPHRYASPFTEPAG